jgi:hypothetical protein
MGTGLISGKTGRVGAMRIPIHDPYKDKIISEFLAELRDCPPAYLAGIADGLRANREKWEEKAAMDRRRAEKTKGVGHGQGEKGSGLRARFQAVSPGADSARTVRI